MTSATPTENEALAAHQALRLRRVVMGGVSYLFTLSMVAVCWWLGYFRLPVLLNYFTVVVLLNVAFYAAIRSNINLRFGDPSMTLMQICVSMLPGLYVMFYAQQARAVLLLLCVSAAMYGLFKFRARDFIVMTVVVVGGYAATMLLVYYVKPHEITVQLEVLQVCALLAVFLQFSALGAYIGGLREKVTQKNKELAGRNDDLEHALRRIEELAMRDELTGVFNRRYLMETIKNEKHRCERSGAIFSICILDVDHFKRVNDTYGHLVGDEVLQAIATTATGALRQTDYFGRYGGEEFALVLTGTMVEGAMITAERVRTRIEALRFASISAQLKVTVSIGIADSRFSEETSATFKRADDALYKAKLSGRNRCVIAAAALPLIPIETNNKGIT
jgi:diguanylate cyclase (GGDEF)-like protein